MILEDGMNLNSPQEIHEEVVNYFQSVLNTEGMHHMDTWKDLFQYVIIDEENDSLCQSPSLEEVIKTTLFDIKKDSSRGPNEFGLCFFMHCWDIIKEDMVEASAVFLMVTPS